MKQKLMRLKEINSELDYMLDIHINPDEEMFSWNVQLTSKK